MVDERLTVAVPVVGPAAPPSRRRRPGLVGATTLLLLVVLAAVLAWGAEPMRIASQSMQPTLRPGEHVLVEKVTRHTREWRRGDLAVFRRPGSDELVAKRIVAVGGDLVAIEDGVLVVDGQPVEEPYADPDAIDSVYFGPVRVPAGAVFVLGDNRGNSLDSRTFGPITVAELRGRVVAVVWPPTHWATR